MAAVHRLWFSTHVEHIRLVVEEVIRWVRPGENIFAIQLFHARNLNLITHHLKNLSYKRFTLIFDQSKLPSLIFKAN